MPFLIIVGSLIVVGASVVVVVVAVANGASLPLSAAMTVVSVFRNQRKRPDTNPVAFVHLKQASRPLSVAPGAPAH